MKRNLIVFAVLAMISTMMLLSGCSSNKKIKQLEAEGYFANSYEDAICQTDIAGMVNAHFAESSSVKKKALLVTVDCMRADGLKYVMDNEIGMSKIAKDGGLYWTKPANLDTKSKIDVGVNFLSIMTGYEPSTFDVLKSTDSKRETPYTLMGSLSNKYTVKFLTDNANYIDIQLASEFKAKASQRLSWSTCKDSNTLRAECLNSLEDSDFISVATSKLFSIAKGNYNLNNKDYLAAMIDMGYNIANVYSQVMTRKNEDWLFIVATTCGGRNNIAVNKETGNILTFMITNKKI